MATCTVDVYIKLPSGKAISSQHLPSDTVQQIAQHLSKSEGVAETRIRLRYQGKTLDKSKTIRYLGICAETILKAEIVFPKDICVMVNFSTGRCDPLTLQNIDTVFTLKKRIEDMDGICPASQVLQVSGQTISGDNKLLCDVGVRDETIITVLEQNLHEEKNLLEGDNSLIKDDVDEEKKQELINTFDASGRNVEVVFCFDTTGSMYSCLSAVRQKLREICQRLLRDVPRMRIGIMAHGDYCDYSEYVTRYTDLTTDVDTLVNFTNNVPSTGGGDAPEVREKLRETVTRLFTDIPNIRIGLMANGDYCDYDKYVVSYTDVTNDIDTVVSFARTVACTGGGGNGGEAYEWALRKAQQLDWSEDSAKAFVMIGDEIPHPPSYTDQNLFWQDELDVLSGMGIKVYGVQAMNAHSSTSFYEELAERTNGFYLQLKDFNLITDMFMAVCYREADQVQLDAFVEEVEKEGRMTENTKLFLDKLEENKPNEQKSRTSKHRRYVAQEWWDPSIRKTHSSPQYRYVQETDSWLPKSGRATYSSTSLTGTSYSPPATSRKTSKLRKLFRSLLRRK